MAELISVIVATYNRPDALNACLRSLAAQSDRDFEVIVADDGSDVSTAAVLNEWSHRLGAPLKHAWHADRGFRLAEIRNRAIRLAEGDYCIFLDGDCLARPGFVAAHRALKEPGWFVTGNRVLLSQKITERTLRLDLRPESWGLGQWLARRLEGDVNRILPLATLPLGKLRKRQPQKWSGARGSNMAFWLPDLIDVDGFDASFTGWGREDSDIFVRMIHNGVRRKDGRFATAVLHLWHPEADRAHLEANDRRLEEVAAGERIRAQHGLSEVIAEIEQSRAAFSPARQAS